MLPFSLSNIQYLDLLGIIQNQLGVFVKDNFDGKFVDEWKSFLDSKGKTLNVSDMSPQIASIMASKEQSEIVKINALSVFFFGIS